MTSETTPAAPNLNARLVTYRDETAFVALPRALWREVGPCNCRVCKGGVAFYDTLAIAVKPAKGQRTGHTWMVHAPEFRDSRPEDA